MGGGVMTNELKIIDPKEKYNINKVTGKYETDEQHYYYVNGYCSLPIWC